MRAPLLAGCQTVAILSLKHMDKREIRGNIYSFFERTVNNKLQYKISTHKKNQLHIITFCDENFNALKYLKEKAGNIPLFFLYQP